MKKLLALILAVLLVLGLVGCSTNVAGDSTTTPSQSTSGEEATDEEATDEEATADTTESTAAQMKFTVTVVYADGTSKDFTYETDEEFVGPVLEEAGLIQGNAGPYGMEITHVDGIKAVYTEDKAYWAVYEGEEYALQGIDTTPVRDGGIYKLVYTRA